MGFFGRLLKFGNLATFEESNSVDFSKAVDFPNFKSPQKKPSKVAVQVHNRPQYFQNLINSLQNSIGIEHVHLIISSDYWSPEMNKITESIKFCKVTRIFYPLSAAFYDGEFPADSPSDCRRDTTTKSRS